MKKFQHELDDVDRRILTALSHEGRLSNKVLAARVGIAASTCHGRVKILEEAGVIRGYRAVLDPEVVGASVQALIAIRVRVEARDRVDRLPDELGRIPGVQRVFLVGGDRDFLVHVACESVDALRALLGKHLGSHPALGETQTYLVFGHTDGTHPL